MKIALNNTTERSTNGTQDITTTGLGTTIGAIGLGAQSTIDSFQSALRLSAGLASSVADQATVQSKIISGRNTFINTNQHYADEGLFLGRRNSNNGGSIVEQAVSAFITDGFTLNYTDASSNVRDFLTLTIASDTEQAKMVKVDENQLNGAFTDTTIPFRPTCALVLTANDDFRGITAHEGYASMTYCFITFDDLGAATYAGQTHSTRLVDGGSTEALAMVNNDAIYTFDPTEDNANFDGKFTLELTSDTNLRLNTVQRTADAQAAEFAIMLIDTGDYDVTVGIADTPTTTGIQSLITGLPSEAQAIIYGINHIESVNTVTTGANAGTMGFGAITRPPDVAAGNAEGCANAMNEIGVSTTNAQNYTSSAAIEVYDDDGGSTNKIKGTFDSFTASTVEVNFTDVSSAAKKFPYIAFSASVEAISSIVTFDVGAPDGTYLTTILSDSTPAEIITSEFREFTSGSTSFSISLEVGAQVYGLVRDNSVPSLFCAPLKAVST
jgi:hypothetical protein